ncbi:MAG: SRPBCC family protein [Gloeotrichia echinulata IR180]|jgi:ribosome-associated toxin RatA of RatAB toxin-antitoxin module
MTANHFLKVTEQHTTTTDLDANLKANLVDATDVLPSVAVQVDKIADRQRQITAKIQIPHPVETVWQVLTDYEALAEFIPSLAKSRLLEHPQGGIRLEQIGSQRLLNFNFCARVVFDLEEYFPKEINFRMVEGDFKGFTGSWCLEPYSLGELMGTNLCYTIQVWPKLTMPVAIIEPRLTKDIRSNLLAIYHRVQMIISNS